jgi:hypothetical protein
MKISSSSSLQNIDTVKNHFIKETIVLGTIPMKVINRGYYILLHTKIPGLKTSPILNLCFK